MKGLRKAHLFLALALLIAFLLGYGVRSALAIPQMDNDKSTVQSTKLTLTTNDKQTDQGYLESLPSWERPEAKRRMEATQERKRRRNIGNGGQAKEWVSAALDECLDFYGTKLGSQQCNPWILEVAEGGDCGGWKIVDIIPWKGQNTKLNRDGSFYIFLSDKDGGEINIYSMTRFNHFTIGMGSTDSDTWQCLSKQTQQPPG